MKSLGIDFGERKIGLAISDELGMIATPHSVLRVKNTSSAISTINKKVQSEGIEQIVIGVPSGYLNIDSPQTNKTREFIKQLQLIVEVPVHEWDESYSTQKAEKGARGRKRKYSDSEAARIILQEYLDRAIPQNPNN